MEGKLRHIETNSFERQNDSECHIAERMLRDVRGCPPWVPLGYLKPWHWLL